MNLIDVILINIIQVILSKEIHFNIEEELPTGSFVGDLRLHIRSEYGSFPKISNINPTLNEYFNLDSWSLKVKKRLDREQICSQFYKNNDCVLKLLIIYGEKQKPLFVTVFVTITDINDNAPKFPELEVEHSVMENANPILSDLFLYQAEDPDRLDNGTVTYQLQINKDVSQNQNFRLQLNADNIPKLIQLAALDYEVQTEYLLELIAFDGGQSPKTGTLKIKIKVKDENDNAPIFEKSKYEETINEDLSVNSKVIEVRAIDADLEENGRVSYQQAVSSTLQQKHSMYYFGIRNYQGKGIIYVKSNIDIDVAPRINTFEFSILACDNGNRQLCSRTTVLIRVIDVNDFRPIIAINYLSTNGKNTGASVILENTINNFIAIVTVTDKDSDPGGIIECQLSNSKFELIQGMNDKDSREIYKGRERPNDQTIFHIQNTKEFDREESDVITFRISCKDNPNLQKSPFVPTQLINDMDITVYIEDVNDNAPQFFRNPYEFRILENSPLNPEIKLKIGVIEANDKDINNKFLYMLIENPFQAFELNQNGVLFIRRPFDREDMAFNPVRVQVSVYDGKFNTTTHVNVHILDDNDLAPVFSQETYRFSCVENSLPTFIGTVEATDGDSEEFMSIEYKIFPPSSLFSVHSRSGLIHVTTRLDREEKDLYSFIIIAIDNSKEKGKRNTGSTTISITVQDINDNYPQIIYPQSQKVLLIDPTWAIGHKVYTIKASDPDSLENGTIIYKIVKDGLGIFNIDPKSGDIFLSKKLSMSENQIVTSHLVLIASDNGQPVPKSTVVSVTIKIAVDNYAENSDFGADYSQANPPQIDKSNRKTLIIIIIVALALIVTVIMTILIVIYQSRIPSQIQVNKIEKEKNAVFQEMQYKNPSLDRTHHFKTLDEKFIVPVTSRYFQNSLGVMRHDENNDGLQDKIHDSSRLNEYQQLMATPTLMRIWHNNLNPSKDHQSVEQESHCLQPAGELTSSISGSFMSNDVINELIKPQSKEQCSSNNYLQSSFV